MSNSEPDISECLSKIRPKSKWCLYGNTLSGLNWENNNSTLAPTQTEIDECWAIIVSEKPLKILRMRRNIKLQECDKYLLPDYPYANDTIKQEWLTYRQALRDLPSNSVPSLDANDNLTNVTWPTPPS